jgi:predicted regulator of Ras-like GTPase activity (Roadblock/LC7/MglB family)
MEIVLELNPFTFHWLLDQFVNNTAGVLDAIAVSSDGLLLAASAGNGRQNTEQLAAITAGLTSLTHGAADMFGMHAVEQVLIEMSGGHMFVASVSDGSALSVLAEKNADLGLVGYEMALLIDRVGAVLTPDLIKHMQNVLVA